MKTLIPALALLALAAPASAHIALDQTTAPGGGYYAGFLRVGHGCGASPTVALRVVIPEGVMIARPQPKPGWTLSVQTTPLAKPVINEGAEVRERVSAITWRGRLPADQFDQFGLMLRLPATGGPLYFPTVQTCEAGENRWTDIPAPGAAWTSVPRPAPILTLVAAAVPAAAAMPEMTHDHH